MSILVNKNTRVVVQGITGMEGSFHTEKMLEYGTQVVAGVTPGKKGQLFLGKVPVYNTMKEAVSSQEANASVIFVPPAFALDAIVEAIDSGVKLIVTITEGIPVNDMMTVKAHLRKTEGVSMIGPNCPGIITPDECKIGIMPGFIHKRGRVGVISRSGTLTYEVVHQLVREGLGQSTAMGIGGDPITGMNFVDVLRLFKEDHETDAIVIIGEIGGTAEEEAAAYIKENVKKPVIAFVAGQTAPPGKRMGHAGAIITGGKGTAKDKINALKSAGIIIVDSPADIGKTVKEVLG